MENKTLDKIKKGDFLTVVKLPPGLFKIQLMRLGILEGDKLFCLERLPGGTIIIQKNRQEIAIGYELAKQIKINLS